MTLKEKLRFYKTSKKLFHLLVREGAKYWLKVNSQVKVIGIVGSFGKTTTSQVIWRLLGPSKAVVTDINLDSVYNLPLTVWRLRRRHRWAVLEMGVDHKGEMSLHLDLVIPDILVMTGITPVHADKELLGSLPGIIKEKTKAALAVGKKGGVIVYNKDNLHLRKWFAKRKNLRLISYGVKRKNVDWRGEKVKISAAGTKFTLVSQKGERITLEGKFWGKQFVYAFLAAAAVAEGLNIPRERLKKVAAQFVPLKGRMSLEKKKFLLVNDSLRANPASVAAGLETIAAIPVKGRRIAVLGEMGELGRYAKKEHFQIGKLISSLPIDVVIGIGPLLKETKRGVGKKVKFFWVPDVVEAGRKLKALNPQKKDLVYLKGSRLKHMERIFLVLAGKRVDCRRISCHFYHHCSQCPYLIEK